MISAEADKLLGEFVASPDSPSDEAVLERIVDGFARPIVTRIIRSCLRGPVVRQEVDDAVAETLLGLLRRLRELKSDPAAGAIADLRGYVATSAYNTCYTQLRQIAPGRYRLRNRVQYLLTHDPDFVLETASGRTHCTYRGAVPGRTAQPLRRAVVRALRDAGGAMEVEELVEQVARVKGMDDTLEVPLDAPDVHAIATTPESVVEYRLTLRRLWDEVRALTPKQRAALLLNLRDSEGRDLIALLPLTGIASMAQIAETLEMAQPELERIWPDLPLDDLAIATLLGATRAQVIKLRRLAREKLRRRLDKLETAVRRPGRFALPLAINEPRAGRSTYAEMTRVVDGTASAMEVELMDAHNADCAACSNDLRDLTEFRREIAR